jgi:hypothetical protein
LFALQVLIVTADEELLKSLREANRLLEQVRTNARLLGRLVMCTGHRPAGPLIFCL